MAYWQHERPLKCPKRHTMTWLGGPFWICGRGKCNTIFVQQGVKDVKEHKERGEAVELGGRLPAEAAEERVPTPVPHKGGGPEAGEDPGRRPLEGALPDSDGTVQAGVSDPEECWWLASNV